MRAIVVACALGGALGAVGAARADAAAASGEAVDDDEGFVAEDDLGLVGQLPWAIPPLGIGLLVAARRHNAQPRLSNRAPTF